MPVELDALLNMLPRRGGVTAPMPQAMPLPAPQIAQMPALPTSPSPVRETGPSGPVRGGMPWGELMRALSPVIGGLAIGGNGPGATGFMQGFQHGAGLAAQEQAKRKQDSDAKQEQAAKFRMEVFNAAKEITDPSEWAKFVDMATDSAMQMGLIQEPSEFKRYLEYPAHLETKHKRDAALARLESLIKSGYDLDQLAEQNASVQVPSGARGTMETYKVRDLITIAGALPEANGKFVAPPKKASDVPNVGSFEDYVLRKFGKNPTAEQITQARKDYNQADDKATDPLLNELRQLRIDTLRGQPGPGGAPALPPRVQSAVDSIARGFGTEPVVRTAQVAAQGVAFANALDINTKNPADDQALIYAFAKAMDPESVVREGEYKTVQMYAQSWAQTFGFNAARIFSNTAFLTPQARANMKATIQKRFATIRGQYDNVRKSYAERINKKTGQGDGESYLTDYGGGFPADAPTENKARIYYDANGDPK